MSAPGSPAEPRYTAADLAAARAEEQGFARTCIAAIEAEAAAHYISGEGGPRMERALEDVMATCVVQLNRLSQRARPVAPKEIRCACGYEVGSGSRIDNSLCTLHGGVHPRGNGWAEWCLRCGSYNCNGEDCPEMSDG